MRRAMRVVAVELVVAAVWVAIGWGAGRLRPLDASWGLLLPSWARVPGAIGLVAGAAGVIICGAMLSGRGIGTLPAGERFMPRDFVSSGPFRYVRNPMSLAAIVLFVGIALCDRSTLALALAAVFAVGLHLLAVRVEEPGLEARFGESYRVYKRHVPRWVPRLRPWNGVVAPASPPAPV